jgi:dipeptidase
MWGAEIGANEHGVAVGNEAVFTNQPYARTGLTGMDLLRLGLERGTTADDTVQIIVSLLERYGQGGGCGFEHPGFTYHNSFIVADPAEAYVLETACRRWATEHVASGVRTISNGLTIPGFAAEYSDRLKTAVSRCRVRQPATARLAGAAREPADLFAVLRDHGGGRRYPHYAPLNGAMAAPCMHGGGVATGSQTTASWAADLTTGAHWVTGTSAPCTSIFKPVSVTRSLELGPSPSGRFDDRTMWWRHELLHRLVVRDPERFYPQFVPERDRLELRWRAEQPDAYDAFTAAAALELRWMETLADPSTGDRRPSYVRAYWRRRNRQAGMPGNIHPAEAKPAG